MIRALVVAALLFATGPVAGQATTRTAFALLGDAPYTQAHANLLDAMIDEINKAKPAFSVHLGDITGGKGPCTDEWFEARVRQFARFASPFVLVLGDNEWTDCHRTGFDPMERLAKIRTLFHSKPVNLPGFRRQAAEYPEHVRWTHDGGLFVGLNVPGSNNNLGRTAEMDAEYAARMKAVFAWLDQALIDASAREVETLVVMMQANPFFERTGQPSASPDGYAELKSRLQAASVKLGKPLLLAHGDTHRFKHDRPVREAPNLVRVEVDGWPWLGWLKVQLAPDPAQPVSVERLLNH